MSDIVNSPRKGLMERVRSIVAALPSFPLKLLKLIPSVGKWAGENKGIIILVLTLMNVFGIIAPETATSLRDALLGIG